MRITGAMLLGVVCGAALSAHGARPERMWVGGAACGHEACLESRLLGRGMLAGRDPSGRIDPETGRDLLNFPPDRVVDYEHMEVRLFIADMNVPEAQAVQTLRLVPIAGPVESLSLDAVGLEVSRVECVPAGSSRRDEVRVLDFEHDGLKLRVRFDPPLAGGEAVELTTTYTIRDPRGGLIWTPETPDWPGRPAQIHTQGEPQTSSLWFPCHDFPNEKLTTQVVVTVPAGFVASSNGRLVSREAVEVAGRGYETFDWLQDTPHVNYLVTLVVGKFDVVDVGSGGRGRVPMPVYVPPGRGGDVEATYGKTAAMVEFFEGLLDEAYPWDQYAQVVVWNFGWGGMENTSATTMYDTAILSPEALVDHDLEGLISHELAHQWFGDLVTCNSWEHIWLNEGFATYLTALWFEHSRGQDDYQAAVRGNFDGVIGAATGSAPGTPAMVSKVWSAPWETFGRQNNPYPHGASVLHMLRMRLGDEVFFRGVAEYLDRMRHQSAETRDFRRAMEDVSGESLERFFWQWCERPGVPRLRIATGWNEQDGFVDVQVEQTQAIDGFNPAYELDIPVWIAVPTGGGVEWIRTSVRTDERTVLARQHITGEPLAVAVDPEMHVLGEVTIDQSAEAWTVVLEHGPTLSARIMAARALGDLVPEESSAASKGDGTSEASGDVEAMQAVALDVAAHDALRIECFKALARRGDLGAMMDPLASPLTPAVRAGAIDAISQAVTDTERFDDRQRAFVAEVASILLEAENPTRVRASAIRAWGRLGQADSLNAIVPFLDADSQDDTLRQSALDALADLDDPRALTLVLDHTHPRTNSRTRATAIGAAVRLAHHDPDLAFTTIAPLLRDRQRRTFLAAGRALVDLGDHRGLEVLRSLRAEVIDPDSAWSLDGWIESLEAKVAPVEAGA